MDDERKIGEGHGEAWIRAGLDELAQVLPAFPDGIHPVDEPGLFGSVTPAIATDQMGYGHHQEPHAPPIQPMEPSMPEQELEIGE